MHLRKPILLVSIVVVSLIEVAAQSGFSPFPKAGDSYWRIQIPKAMRRDYERLGNEYRGKEWRQIPDEVFAEFRTTGNRTNYEDSCFARRRQFSCLVMAEVMQHRGKYMKDICRGLHYFIEKEPWWGLPAHYPKAKPDSAIQVVDLFNSETSSMLAWALYMLSDEIDRAEPGLAEHVSCEIKRRFLIPTLTEKHGWMQSVNNWNTWIMSNFIETCLICYSPESEELGRAMKASEDCLRLFLGGYPDDGGCEEGVGYWDRAGASFFESLWMREVTQPYLPASYRYSVTPDELDKVAAMGRFIVIMHVHDLAFVNFSDAMVKNVPNINILLPYGAWLAGKNSAVAHEYGMHMMEFAAYIASEYDYFNKPTTLFLQSGNWPTLGRELMLLSLLPQLRERQCVQPHTTDAWLADSQVMVARSDGWLVAAKGGNNDESHNHNDVGSFIIYRNKKPVVIDLGRDTYTSQTFSSRRYEMTNNRSMYHNVPIINGFEQKDGKKYRATDVNHTFTDSVSTMLIDIAKAYPEETGVKSWVRRLALNRKQDRVEVTESVVMDEDRGLSAHACPAEITLMCYGEPKILQDGRIALADGDAVLAYSPDMVHASWSKVEMNDGIMKTQWKDNVYRIALKPRMHSGIVEYQFE